MKFRKKQDESRHPDRAQYKKQQSYHYSAQRSQSERLLGRRETSADENRTAAARKSSGKLQKLPIYASILLIGLGLLYLLHLSPQVSITTASDQDFIGDKTALQKEADDYMKASFAHRSKLSFDSEDLEQKLAADFPQFSAVNVKKYFFRKNIEVEVEFARPAITLTTGSNVYVVSEQGVILADITHDKPSFDITELPLVQDDTGVELKTGNVALTADQVAYIQEVIFQTKRKKLNVQTMALAAGGGELDVRFGGLAYYVKFNFYEDARKSSGTFLATRANLAEKGVTPSQYIDVRIPERAYVK